MQGVWPSRSDSKVHGRYIQPVGALWSLAMVPIECLLSGPCHLRIEMGKEEGTEKIWGFLRPNSPRGYIERRPHFKLLHKQGC